VPQQHVTESAMCYSEILATATKYSALIFIVLMCLLVRLGTAYGKHLLTPLDIV